MQHDPDCQVRAENEEGASPYGCDCTREERIREALQTLTKERDRCREVLLVAVRAMNVCDGDHWKCIAIFNTLCEEAAPLIRDRENALASLRNEIDRHKYLGAVGCECGQWRLPKGEGDDWSGVLAWRNHRAEAVALASRDTSLGNLGGTR